MSHLMTAKETAEYLRLHEVTVCKYAKEGKIPGFRIGRIWWFERDTIDEWIAGGNQQENNGNDEG